MAFKYLKTELDDAGVLTVQFARRPVNALNQEMYREIAALFSAPDQLSAGIKSILLTGDGRHFCAGNDLDEFASMTPENGSERMWRVREAFFAIQFCPLPVVAAVHGSCLGSGLAVAASCDFVVAATNARLGLPELTVGVMGGARHLARIAPQPLVRRMFLCSEILSASDMAQAGASLIICEEDQLRKTANTYATRIASFSPTAVRLSKQILNRIETMDMRAGYEFEQGYTIRMSGHADSKEALRAFREKRTANYIPLRDHTNGIGTV